MSDVSEESILAMSRPKKLILCPRTSCWTWSSPTIRSLAVPCLIIADCSGSMAGSPHRFR